MKVDQSMITGESEPVESVVNAADPNALEAKNIIFNGSLGTVRILFLSHYPHNIIFHSHYITFYLDHIIIYPPYVISFLTLTS